jgi:Fe2+ transport system protein FeoA
MMASGEVGRVVQVVGVPEVVHRLAEMGLQEQVRIRMIQQGSPCIVAVEDHRLSFRAADEIKVLVALNGLF